MALQRVKDALPLLPILETVENVAHRKKVRALRAAEDAVVATLELQEPTDLVVVIPTYRRGESLLRAIHSVLEQTYGGSVRVVVVDDGGGAAREVAPADDRVVVLELPVNLGVAGVVRNIGIRCSRSRLVAFLDDDNWWDPEHVERCVATLTSDGTSIAYAGLRLVAPDGTPLRPVYPDPPQFDRRLLRLRNYVDTSAIVAYRTPEVLFSRLPRRRGARNIEDWELIYRLTRTERCSRVPAVTVNYTVNPDSYFSQWP